MAKSEGEGEEGCTGSPDGEELSIPGSDKEATEAVTRMVEKEDAERSYGWLIYPVPDYVIHE